MLSGAFTQKFQHSLKLPTSEYPQVGTRKTKSSSRVLENSGVETATKKVGSKMIRELRMQEELTVWGGCSAMLNDMMTMDGVDCGGVVTNMIVGAVVAVVSNPVVQGAAAGAAGNIISNAVTNPPQATPPSTQTYTGFQSSQFPWDVHTLSGGLIGGGSGGTAAPSYSDR
jgi:hypothetical protein